MLKIVYLTPMATHPVDAGSKKRMVNIVNALRKYGAEFYPIVSAFHEVSDEQKAAMEAYWGEVCYVEGRSKKLSNVSEGYGIDDWYNPELTDAIARIVAEKKPDLIYTNYCFMTRFRDEGIDLPVILDTHDILSSRTSLYEQIGSAPGFFYTTPEEEERGLKRADVVMGIQPRETDLLKERLPEHDVITVGQPCQAWPPEMRAVTEVKKIGFIGSGHLFNRHGIDTFIQFYGQYFDSYPGQPEVVLAGKICDHVSQSPPWLIKHGFVEDISEFFNSVDLMISPVEVGTGLKIKTVEAFCSGRPTISTDIGSDGLEAVDLAHKCFSIEAMMSEIYWVIKEPERLAELEQTSQALARSYMDSSAAELQVLWERMSALAGKSEDMHPSFNNQVRPVQLGKLADVQLSSDKVGHLGEGWKEATGGAFWNVAKGAKLELDFTEATSDTEVLFVDLMIPDNLGGTCKMFFDGEELLTSTVTNGINRLRCLLPESSRGLHDLAFELSDEAGNSEVRSYRLDRVGKQENGIKPGTVVSLGDENSSGYLGQGWSWAEGTHIWSNAERAFLHFSLPTHEGQPVFELQIIIPEDTKFSLLWGDQLLYSEVGTDSWKKINVPLPKEVSDDQKECMLILESSKLFAPPNSMRELGVCVYAMSVVYKDINGSEKAGA